MVYAVVTLFLFAMGIGFFIGMLSFKKKKHDEWDKQGKFGHRLQTALDGPNHSKSMDFKKYFKC